MRFIGFLVYENSLDIMAGLILSGFVLVLVRMMLSRPRGWRDLSVVTMVFASMFFWILIAGRRIFSWPSEVILVAFVVQLIGVYAVAAHVWTQRNGNR